MSVCGVVVGVVVSVWTVGGGALLTVKIIICGSGVRDKQIDTVMQYICNQRRI